MLTILLATQATTKFPCFSICTGHPILFDWREWQGWAGGRPRWSSNRGHCYTQGCSWCKKRCCVRFSSSRSIHHSFRYKLFCLLREIQKITDDNITIQWQIPEILFGPRARWHLSFCLLLLKKKKKILGFHVTKCANLSEMDCWTSCHRNEVNKLKYERIQELAIMFWQLELHSIML